MMPGAAGSAAGSPDRSASFVDIGGNLQVEARAEYPGLRLAANQVLRRCRPTMHAPKGRLQERSEPMLHATLKSIHLLAMFVWLGGMFFTLVCLRPALGVIEPPPLRLRLMNAVFRRFFAAV